MQNPDQNPDLQRFCPVCDFEEPVFFLEKDGIRLVQCPQCRMIFTSPVPEEFITGIFYDRLSTPFYLSPDKLESDYSPVRFQRELKLFRRFCRGGRVLDVGCSTGGFLHQLRRQFPGSYDVVGTDVAGPALDHAAKQGIPILGQNFLSGDFSGKKFHAITFGAVMEHLHQPARFLQRAAALLEPAGTCFILVPNFKSLAVRLLGSKYRYVMAEHLNYFARLTLEQFVKREPALKVETMGTSHFNPIVLLNDFRNPRARVPEAERAGLLKKTTQYKNNPWLTPAQWLYHGMEKALSVTGLADNLYVVLRKK